VDANWSAVVADFNGDGAPDLADSFNQWIQVGGIPTGSVSILLNDSPGNGFLATGVSSASYVWPTGATSMVIAFGTNLAPQTAIAQDPTNPPTTLGGIRVHLLDRVITIGPNDTDILAPLFYVSPSQINFELSTQGTFVYIGIEQVGSPFVQQGLIIPVRPVAPDLYTLNASGLAAATAVSVASDGSQTQIPVVSCVGALCSAVPLNLTGNPVYLSLYGTGFGASSTQSNAVCTVGGVDVQPTYFGPQLQIPGFDQINLLLPQSLAGAGTARIQCSVTTSSATVNTNSVYVVVH
jgi:uncharacterized protein (TIGR03437 family)